MLMAKRESMTQESQFDARLDLVPMNPGVYLMKDTSGSVIYVGKALHLKNRLRNYFTLNPKGNAKVLAMISHITDFSYIVCENELEALLLECNLIKEYRPHYNILLRDDKEYPYLRITLDEEYPRVLKSFRVGLDIKKGARYYGPYLSNNLKKALETLETIFPMKTCNRLLPRDIGKQRPCLRYFIGKCTGPCKGDVCADEYRKGIMDICLFLEGRYDGLVKELDNQMKKAATDYDYEKAALYRDRLMSLKQIMVKQTVSTSTKGDLDVIGIEGNGNEVCIQKLEIRQGRIIGNATFFAHEEDAQDEILETILLQHYIEAPLIPPEILLPIQFENMVTFREAIINLRKGNVELRVPQRGYGKELLFLANNNAKQSLRRHTLLVGNSKIATGETLDKLSVIVFGETGRLKRIEAFDISNHGQDDISASMVVFIDGKPHKSSYRLFKIKQQEYQDDYSAMRQAITRRLKRIGEEGFGENPDLIFVDGGKGHITVAKESLEETGNVIALLGMVKDNRHRTRGLLFPDGRMIDLSPDIETTGLEREEKLGLLRLISAIQDEAHRFAFQFTKKLSKKRNMKFTLEGIEGIGPARRKELLTTFSSLRAIEQASLEDIMNVKGITKAVAEAVFNHFHKEGNTD